MSNALSWPEVVRRYVDSMESLEVLLLLQRTPDTYWTPVALDSHFGLKAGVAEKRLQELRRHGLVTLGNNGGFRYMPLDDAVRDGVAELAVAYADRRSTVLNTVFSENLKRLRAFSDAFKVKSE